MRYTGSGTQFTILLQEKLHRVLSYIMEPVKEWLYMCAFNPA